MLAASGVNKEIAQLPATAQATLKNACGEGSGGQGLPLEVPPTGKFKCPQGYEFNPATKKCRLLTQRDGDFRERVARWWDQFRFVEIAEARLMSLNFKLSDFFQDIQFSYDEPGALDTAAVCSFQGFGFQIVWTDGP